MRWRRGKMDARLFIRINFRVNTMKQANEGISLSVRPLLWDKGKRQQSALSCDQSAELKDREELNGKIDGY